MSDEQTVRPDGAPTEQARRVQRYLDGLPELDEHIRQRPDIARVATPTSPNTGWPLTYDDVAALVAYALDSFRREPGEQARSETAIETAARNLFRAICAEHERGETFPVPVSMCTNALREALGEEYPQPRDRLACVECGHSSRWHGDHDGRPVDGDECWHVQDVAGPVGPPVSHTDGIRCACAGYRYIPAAASDGLTDHATVSGVVLRDQTRTGQERPVARLADQQDGGARS